MKKNDVLLLCSAIGFSGLFYQQLAGINYVIFTLMVLLCLLLFKPENKNNPSWWILAACSLVAALSVYFTNSQLSVLATIISLLVLSSKNINRENSILLSFLFACFSLLSALVFWIASLLENNTEDGATTTKKNWKFIGTITLSALLLLLFFNLYRLSNPLFADFTKCINLDWLSIGWLFFTFFGFLVMYGLLKSKSITRLQLFENKAKQDIQNDSTNDEKHDEQLIWIGSILFACLNLMLLFLNGLDVVNIYISQKLPAGITLSNFVHEAVWSTVFSIIIAAGLIAWLFKGELNFVKAAQKIKYLIYFWIAQSMLVVINTMVRNSWYIQQYQLSYLRIGVFVFLILCLAGLLLTYYKVAKQKSVWNLFTSNVAIWYTLLIIAAPFNWDQVITRYNIEHASKTKPLDLYYLYYLSDANIPELCSLLKRADVNKSDKRFIYTKLRATYLHDRYRTWPSNNYRITQNTKAMLHLFEN